MKEYSCYFEEEALETLCQNIDMPKEATATILSLRQSMNIDAYKEIFSRLFQPKLAPDATKELQEKATAYNGMEALLVLLAAGSHTYEVYQENGISDLIFYETMGFFSRCVKEGIHWDGKPTFDRTFWGWRHLNGIIYRLGTLEFEIKLIDEQGAEYSGLTIGTTALSVHIPGDATLTEESIKDSFYQADVFFKELGYHTPLPIVCNSWLLSTELAKLLPDTSGIKVFQAQFNITRVFPESNSSRLWLFGRVGDDVTKYPTNTSLQKKVKEHLLAGNVIGDAYGVVKR